MAFDKKDAVGIFLFQKMLDNFDYLFTVVISINAIKQF